MKVAYLVHQYLPDHIGGTEIYVRGLAARAVARGHSVEVVTYRESPSSDPADFEVCRRTVEGVPVTEIPYNLSIARQPARSEFDNRFVADLVERELRRFSPDVVHAAHAMKLSGAAIRRCHALGIPCVVTLCDYWFLCLRHTLLREDGEPCRGPHKGLDCRRCLEETHGFCSFRIFRKGIAPQKALRNLITLVGDLRSLPRRKEFLFETLLRCRRIVALTPFLRRIFAENGFPAGRIEVLPHGVERPATLPGRRIAGGPARIAFIGSLVPHKGAHVLLDALARMPDLDVRCTLYGAIRESDGYVRRLLERGRRDPRIRFAGTFPPERLWQVLSESDLLAMPALWYENGPLVVKAALHLGVPVLASDLGTLSDMVRDGIDGRLVPPGRPDDWARALREWTGGAGPREIAPVPAPDMDDHAGAMFAIYETERRR